MPLPIWHDLLMKLKAELERANSLYLVGRLSEAEQAYESVCARGGAVAEAWYRRAIIGHKQGDMLAALDRIEKAIGLDRSQPAFYYMEGMIREDMDDYTGALDAYRRALSLHPGFAEALNNMGLVLARQGKILEAIQAIERAIEVTPSYAHAWNNLGTLYKDMGALGKAESSFLEALKYKAGYGAAHSNLGVVYMMTRQTEKAKHHFILAAKCNPNNAQAYNNLGLAFKLLGDIGQAIANVSKAIELNPNYLEAINNLAALYAKINRTDQAIQLYQKAQSIAPANLQAALGYALTLPVVYESTEHIHRMRDRYGAELQKLNAAWPDYLKSPVDEITKALERTNFYLAYQGQADKTLQVMYGILVQNIINSSMPRFERSPVQQTKIRRKKRLGFVSTLFHKCTVGYYFKSWVLNTDKAVFETYVYNIGNLEDELTDGIKSAADKYLLLHGNIVDIASIIRRDEVDILVYPEIGMFGKTFLLASTRLAPVQCAAWGHPVTTGLPSIDYYISCDEMEPANAEDEYSEKLVRLPGIGVCYEMPQAQAIKSRAELQLPVDGELILYPQSLYKIHPDNDDLLIDILSSVKDARVVMFKGVHPEVTNCYFHRIAQKCRDRGIDPVRLIFLDPMPHGDYLSVNLACDLMLDTLYWSGGNTALDALACGLPIVTLPGEFMRGRQTMAFLELIDCADLIANSSRAYVDLAIDLLSNREKRASLAKKIRENNSYIFNQVEPVRALNTFLAGL